jgi:hypothetical protein
MGAGRRHEPIVSGETDSSQREDARFVAAFPDLSRAELTLVQWLTCKIVYFSVFC